MTTDQKFCRSCGADLQGTGVTVADGSIGVDGERTNHLMLLGFVVMFAGAAVGVVGKMLLHADAVTVVGVLAALAGMFIVVYPSLNPARRRRQALASAARPEIFLPAEPTKKLTPVNEADFIPSVTESTTDLLITSASNVNQSTSTDRSRT
jgi:hypothetical protein